MLEFLTGSTESNQGFVTLRATLIFSVAAIVLAILVAPMLDDYSEHYAQTRGYGIDGVVTGSVEKPKRYVLQRSVLSITPVKICANGEIDKC